MLDNAADRTSDKNQAWVDKAEKMRLLQDSVTAHGSDVLWVWHLEDAQLNGQTHVRETLPERERERLFRSLNASLRIVRDNDRRGILVEWSREGPSGMVLWDELGHGRVCRSGSRRPSTDGAMPDQHPRLPSHRSPSPKPRRPSRRHPGPT